MKTLPAGSYSDIAASGSSCRKRPAKAGSAGRDGAVGQHQAAVEMALGGGRRATRGRAAAGAGTPRSPGSLHAAPVLAAHFVERIAYLHERAAFDGIDQNREAVAILDH